MASLEKVSLDFASLVTKKYYEILFVFYCLDAYGSGMWDYSSQYVKTFYIAWLKVVRRIWSLPYTI